MFFSFFLFFLLLPFANAAASVLFLAFSSSGVWLLITSFLLGMVKIIEPTSRSA